MFHLIATWSDGDVTTDLLSAADVIDRLTRAFALRGRVQVTSVMVVPA